MKLDDIEHTDDEGTANQELVKVKTYEEFIRLLETNGHILSTPQGWFTWVNLGNNLVEVREI